MEGEAKERWGVLCEKAAVEQDPDVLLALVKEINEGTQSCKRTREGRWTGAY